jgi:hypothetical protein
MLFNKIKTVVLKKLYKIKNKIIQVCTQCKPRASSFASSLVVVLLMAINTSVILCYTIYSPLIM